ncbi:MAG: bifunctional metallophosphatase/5'-nucleotidase [Bacteroidales bacterium]|nr:bifunctional metallophosphatase/5'-nucleotidase [Bacteroidales bacterium]
MLRHYFRTLFIVSGLLVGAMAQGQSVRVVYTTDVHGAIFPYDYVKGEEAQHSMAQAVHYIEDVRKESDNVILLDAGDMLQGTPAVYYYDHVDSVRNVIPMIYNSLKYDAVCIGNHDIETGHAVYDKFVRQMNMPVLGANAVNKETGKPYFQPYTILERGGKKIAVIGLTTPYVPHWLPEYYWSGIEFEDMIESAHYWMNYVRDNEKPDAVIGLFHSGYDYTHSFQTAEDKCNENASVLVAQQVEGFDVILIGHDHKVYNQVVKSPSGREVPVCDAGTAARYVGDVTIEFVAGEARPRVTSKLVALTNQKESSKYNKEFLPQMLAVKAYSKKVVGQLKEELISSESLFGSAKFTNLVHATMLKHSGAEISVAAPLLIDANLPVGEVTVGNMFSIYKFENMLSVIKLTGAELKKYLEYSYDEWIDNPSVTGHLIKVNKRGRIINRVYNFDSAVGIIYTVDPYKTKGERVEIKSMQDGTPFDESRLYTVALSSYRYNGGGGHLTKGLGFSKEQIAERSVKNVLSDLRGLIMQDIIDMGGDIVIPEYNNWKFVPEAEVKQYIEKDRELLGVK